ncbi:MAG: PPC domain-containing protein [Phycisphaerae bacterium]
MQAIKKPAATAMTFLAMAAATGAAPQLSQILPRGGTRGTEIVCDFTGARLDGTEEILFHEPGITVTKIEPVGGSRVKATLKIASDCPLGPHAMRVRTQAGLSELRVFSVGALRELAEPEPNGDRSKAPTVALDSTINGRITNEDVDYFAFDAAAGVRVNIEIEAMRLGGPLFDPRIALLDATGRELAASDDTCLVRQDAVIGYTFEKAGRYVVEVREAAYGGGGSDWYRLHLGTFPRPLGVFPPGGKAGEKIEVTWLGDAKMGKQTIQLPAGAVWPFGLFPSTDEGVAPSRVPFRVSPSPNVLEVEPNDGPAAATPFATPAAVNGIIGQQGDVDWFRFDGKKGQVFDVRVWARRLRSPLDSVLNVWALQKKGPDAPFATGGHLAGNDDSGGPDSFVRVTLPADGTYAFRVRDHLGRGGPLYTYRVEVTPVQPRLRLGLSPSDRPIRCAVPQGGRQAILLSAARTDFGGPLKVAIDDLPAGVTVETPDMPANVSLIPVLLTASADAPPAATLANVTGHHADPKQDITGGFAQDVVTVYGANRTVFMTHRVARLPVAVVRAAPFDIAIVQSKVPIVRHGMMQLKVVCHRAEGFAGPIALRILWNPPGLHSGSATIAANQSEALLHINAAGGAAIGRWPIAVVASAAADGDTVEVSSQLATLDVSDVWVAFKLKRARVERGHAVDLTVEVQKKHDFEGTARVELVGLPRSVATKPLEITKDSTELVFPIDTKPDAPAGRHRGLFVRATIMAHGEPIVHQSGGGQLMIDKPLPPKPKEDKKKKPKRRRRPRNKGDVRTQARRTTRLSPAAPEPSRGLQPARPLPVNTAPTAKLPA